MVREAFAVPSYILVIVPVSAAVSALGVIAPMLPTAEVELRL